MLLAATSEGVGAFWQQLCGSLSQSPYVCVYMCEMMRWICRLQYIFFLHCKPVIFVTPRSTLPVCPSFFCIAGNFHKDATGPQISISFTYVVLFHYPLEVDATFQRRVTQNELQQCTPQTKVSETVQVMCPGITPWLVYFYVHKLKVRSPSLMIYTF